MNVTSIIRKHWFNAFSLLLAIGSIVYSVFIYNKSISIRDPVFMIDSTRTRIIEADRVVTAPLKVTRSDGRQILNDVTAVKIYFWNKGKLPIRPEHVLRPLKIRFTDPGCEIIDYKLLSVSRDISNIQINRSQEYPTGAIDINFTILEYSDGFSAQIIFAGTPDAPVICEGNIEGVLRDIDDGSLPNIRFWEVYGDGLWKMVKSIPYISGMIIIIFIIALFEKHAGGIFSKLGISPKQQNRIAAATVIGMMLLIVFFMLIYLPIKMSSDKASSTLTEVVPNKIRTNE